MFKLSNLEETINAISEEVKILDKILAIPNHAIVNSQRLASVKDQIGERGSIKDRLARTPEEASIIRQTETVRLGLPESKQLTQDDEKVLERMADDIIRNVLEGG